jgi:hypothetical protein
MTGIELHIAAAAVAEVYLRLVLYRHDPSVLYQSEQQQSELGSTDTYLRHDDASNLIIQCREDLDMHT